jgi:hypothetical protein
MLLKTDKTPEQKWLMTAKKQTKKGHGNVPTEPLKNKTKKNQQQDWQNKGEKMTGNGKKKQGKVHVQLSLGLKGHTPREVATF